MGLGMRAFLADHADKLARKVRAVLDATPR
jgi:hypothetical protein